MAKKFLAAIYRCADATVGLIVPTAVVLLMWQSFVWMDNGLRAIGVSSLLWHSAIAWLIIGVVCALFWPLRYREGMRGLWRENALHISLLSLAGPWALIFGFPI